MLTDEDLLNHQRTLTTDPDFRPDMNQLSDALGVTEVKATPEGVRLLAAGSQFRRGSRRAFVTNSETAYGLARMFELSRVDAEDEFRVFRTMDEAREWLGLPADAHY